MRAPRPLKRADGRLRRFGPGGEAIPFALSAFRTDADPAVLEEIRAAAENGSPVTQNVLKGTPIQADVKKV